MIVRSSNALRSSQGFSSASSLLLNGPSLKATPS